MKVQCPYCKTLFSTPDEYRDKRIKCKFCQKKLIAAPFEKSPIIVPIKQVLQAKVAKKIWLKSPIALRSGFFATLGVISALFVVIYMYGHLFSNRHPNDFQEVKSKLSVYKLFPVNFIGDFEILRGRLLQKYTFLPDANRQNPYIAVWFDEDRGFSGITASWQGSFCGRAADIAESKIGFYCNNAVCDGFKSLTGFDLENLPGKSFVFKDGDNTYDAIYENWRISIHQKVTQNTGSDYHDKWCELLASFHNIEKPDYSIYHYFVIAYNWQKK